MYIYLLSLLSELVFKIDIGIVLHVLL